MRTEYQMKVSTIHIVSDQWNGIEYVTLWYTWHNHNFPLLQANNCYILVYFILIDLQQIQIYLMMQACHVNPPYQ